jgi:hypothetical protein
MKFNSHVWCTVTFVKHGEASNQSLHPPSMWCIYLYMGMDQYLLIPFLGGWTSIYQLFWCSPGVQGFDTLPYNCDVFTIKPSYLIGISTLRGVQFHFLWPWISQLLGFLSHRPIPNLTPSAQVLITLITHKPHDIYIYIYIYIRKMIHPPTKNPSRS